MPDGSARSIGGDLGGDYPNPAKLIRYRQLFKTGLNCLRIEDSVCATRIAAIAILGESGAMAISDGR